MDGESAIQLTDWRHRVFAMYATAHAETAGDSTRAWDGWRRTRDLLFRTHPQSPIRAERRAGFEGLPYFDHDPSYRVAADVRPTDPETLHLEVSTGEPVLFARVGRCAFVLSGNACSLDLFWLEG